MGAERKKLQDRNLNLSKCTGLKILYAEYHGRTENEKNNFLNALKYDRTTQFCILKAKSGEDSD